MEQHSGPLAQAFAHRRPARDDDQVRGLQAGGHFVEIGEAGAQAGEGLVLLEQGLDAVHRLGEQVLDGLETAAPLGPLLGDLEDLALGLVEQLAALAPLGLKALIGDLGAHLDQLAQHRVLAHDVRIGADVGGARGVLRQGADVGEAAGILQQGAPLQLLGDGHHVEGLAFPRQIGDGAEDDAVFPAVEVPLADPIRHLVPGAVVQHQPPQHRLLRLYRMRGQAQGRYTLIIGVVVRGAIVRGKGGGASCIGV
jgi:hypothetical protein